MKKIALVTGASSGFGLQYATELARQKYDLLLVSNQEKELQETATKLHNEFGIEAEAVFKDLSEENAAEELHTHCINQGYEVDILINNAGVFFFNAFNNTNLPRINAQPTCENVEQDVLVFWKRHERKRLWLYPKYVIYVSLDGYARDQCI